MDRGSDLFRCEQELTPICVTKQHGTRWRIRKCKPHRPPEPRRPLSGLRAKAPVARGHSKVSRPPKTPLALFGCGAGLSEPAAPFFRSAASVPPAFPGQRDRFLAQLSGRPRCCSPALTVSLRDSPESQRGGPTTKPLYSEAPAIDRRISTPRLSCSSLAAKLIRK